jgi:hypothetical protein
VVLVAVPHEAFDVVRSESDMGGRVSLVAIALWTVEDLEFIAHEESEALNIEGQHGVATKLAENIHRIANRTPPEPYWNLGRPPPPHNSTKKPRRSGASSHSGGGMQADIPDQGLQPDCVYRAECAEGPTLRISELRRLP